MLKIKDNVDLISKLDISNKKEKQEELEFIEKRCTYDSHLQGYCMGLTPGEVRTLVLKLGGKKEV